MEQLGIATIYTDNDWNSELEGFHITNIVVHDKSECIDSPVELGKVLFDNKVLSPIRIRVEGYIKHEDFYDVINWIKEMAWNRSWDFYSICTKSAAYKNLVLLTNVETQSSDKFDVVAYTLEFSEVLTSEDTNDKRQETIQTTSLPDTFDVCDRDTGAGGGMSKR